MNSAGANETEQGESVAPATENKQEKPVDPVTENNQYPSSMNSSNVELKSVCPITSTSNAENNANNQFTNDGNNSIPTGDTKVVPGKNDTHKTGTQ